MYSVLIVRWHGGCGLCINAFTLLWIAHLLKKREKKCLLGKSNRF